MLIDPVWLVIDAVLALSYVIGLTSLVVANRHLGKARATCDALKRELDSLPKRNSKGRFESR